MEPVRSPDETREIELVDAREMVAVSSSRAVVPPLANCFDMTDCAFDCLLAVCCLLLCRGGVVVDVLSANVRSVGFFDNNVVDTIVLCIYCKQCCVFFVVDKPRQII